MASDLHSILSTKKDADKQLKSTAKALNDLNSAANGHFISRYLFFASSMETFAISS